MQGLVDGDEQEVLAEYVNTLQDVVNWSRLNPVGHCINMSAGSETGSGGTSMLTPCRLRQCQRSTERLVMVQSRDSAGVIRLPGRQRGVHVVSAFKGCGW